MRVAWCLLTILRRAIIACIACMAHLVCMAIDTNNEVDIRFAQRGCVSCASCTSCKLFFRCTYVSVWMEIKTEWNATYLIKTILFHRLQARGMSDVEFVTMSDVESGVMYSRDKRHVCCWDDTDRAETTPMPWHRKLISVGREQCIMLKQERFLLLRHSIDTHF